MADENTIVNINYSISPYDVAVQEGFTGTEAEWLASLVGAPGADGADATGGGVTVTVSNGATIVHDGSGTAPPTFVDNGSGVGTLVSNGNVIQSVSGQFGASGTGSYTFNHDVNDPAGTAVINVSSEVYLVQTGTPPFSRAPNLAGIDQHVWSGLINSALHSFVWNF